MFVLVCRACSSLVIRPRSLGICDVWRTCCVRATLWIKPRALLYCFMGGDCSPQYDRICAPYFSCKLCCTSSCVYVDLWTFYPLHTRLFDVMRPAALFVVRPADLLLFVWCIGPSAFCIITAAMTASTRCISAALAASFRCIAAALAASFRCRARDHLR